MAQFHQVFEESFEGLGDESGLLNLDMGTWMSMKSTPFFVRRTR